MCFLYFFGGFPFGGLFLFDKEGERVVVEGKDREEERGKRRGLKSFFKKLFFSFLREGALVLRKGLAALLSKGVDATRIAVNLAHHLTNETVCLALGINLGAHFVVLAPRDDDFGTVSVEESLGFCFVLVWERKRMRLS
jgi:hypothetical protein